MKEEPKRFSLRAAAKAVLAVLAVLIVCSVLFASILAIDHSLHRSVHHDSDHAEHQCLAVILSHGQLEVTGFTSIVVAVALLLIGKSLPVLTVSLPSPHYRLLPGRAPPFSLA